MTQASDITDNFGMPSTAGLVAQFIANAIPGYQPPVNLWQNQQLVYDAAWKWYTNEVLTQVDDVDERGENVLRFPLKLGMRNILRKHVSMLFGVTPNQPAPLVKTIVSPKTPLQWVPVKEITLGETEPTEDEKLAIYCQNVMNEVWNASGGSALMQMNALMGQYFGGSVFRIKYVPTRTDLIIPVIIQSLRPDFFYPIWSEDDPDNLLEVFVCYYVASAVAKRQYGVETNNAGYTVYIEHWTREKYSIFFDGKPLTQTIAGETITFKDRPHQFGLVPYTYIPHLREMGFYGQTHIGDIDGIIKELNARLSDQGLAVKKNIGIKYTIKNTSVKNPYEIKLPFGLRAIHLGSAVPNTEAPSLEPLEPPKLPEGTKEFISSLTNFLWRESHTSSVQYGEDEGSQRSGDTLEIRLLPGTSHADQERVFWDTGAARIFRIVMTILNKQPVAGLPKIPDDFMRRLQVHLDWSPQVPRGRDSLVQEVTTRVSGETPTMSPETAMERLGDIRDIPKELEQIKAYQLFKASLTATPESEDESDTSEGADKKEDSKTPEKQNAN